MKKKPTILQALTPIIFIVVALTIGYGYFKMKIEPLMVISAFVAGFYSFKTRIYMERNARCNNRKDIKCFTCNTNTLECRIFDRSTYVFWNSAYDNLLWSSNDKS